MTPVAWVGMVAALFSFLGITLAAYITAKNSLTGKLIEENRALQKDLDERAQRLQQRLDQLEETVANLRQ